MIRTGDRVKVLNENAEGIVIKMPGNDRAIVQIGDFEYEYPVEQLICVNKEPLPPSPLKNQQEKIHFRIKQIISENDSGPGKAKKVRLKKGRKSFSAREVDLHCHEIIDNCAGMSNSRILDYQVNYFLQELENAIAAGERNIIFIHGKGEGVLKTEIHRILKSHHNIVFYDAPWKFYGGGATQVEIH